MSCESRNVDTVDHLSSTYVPRLAGRQISELLAEFSALLFVGPRASGKTTTAARHARSVIPLDEPREAALSRPTPTPRCEAEQSPC